MCCTKMCCSSRRNKIRNWDMHAKISATPIEKKCEKITYNGFIICMGNFSKCKEKITENIDGGL